MHTHCPVPQLGSAILWPAHNPEGHPAPRDTACPNSYEVQKEYYTDKIMSNTAWTMAGIFADKGITGTSARKREDFMRMIRHCRQKKIDVILTKSVSRFSRNTVDCLYYIRALKQLGIAVIFEKENINSLEEDSELRITLSGAFAQSESESISANVTWGKRRAMEAGKVSIQYKKLYGYRKGGDGQPEIIPEQAEIVRWLYERYLTGASLRMIKDELEQQGVKCFKDSPEWTISRIRSILQNEKYCGDVLMQKTFRQDFINRKAIKNTGQLPMYLIENHHEGIVSREKYDAVQAEMARRNAAKSPSKNAVTGMASYASKYALSERLVCGEYGTLYRRCTWTRNGEKRVVWRCVSRLDYGKKYCHNSPTLDEAPLQQAILAVLNTAMAGLRRIRSPDRHEPGQPPGYVSHLQRRLCRKDVPPDGPHRPPRQCGRPRYTADFEAAWQDVLDGCQGLLRELTTE